MKITVQKYRRTKKKHRKAKKGHGWTKLERIEKDCIWVNLKNVDPPFFKFMLVYIKISFRQRENHSSCYVALILQMKDSCSANLTFRAHN